MTVHRDDGKVQLECDEPGCKKTSEIYPSSKYKEMMQDAKALGWVTYKEDGKWINRCQWRNH